jgi:hypothetical protein
VRLYHRCRHCATYWVFEGETLNDVIEAREKLNRAGALAANNGGSLPAPNDELRGETPRPVVLWRSWYDNKRHTEITPVYPERTNGADSGKV